MITEGGAAPNVVPDHTVADFYIRYPDEVYLAQESKMVDDAARAAALATGTKVKIDHYGTDRDGIGSCPCSCTSSVFVLWSRRCGRVLR